MTIDDVFHARCRGEAGAIHRDILEHMPTLRRLADGCASVVEFGTRTGNSTIAFLASRARRVDSYDIAEVCLFLPDDCAERWTFHRNDTSTLADIPGCDMLFIDTLHSYGQVKAELRHAGRVARFLVFHDTVTFGSHDENHTQGPGICSAVFEFLARHPEWRVSEHYSHNNGLTVLARTQPHTRPFTINLP